MSDSSRLRPARVTETTELADLILQSGENLLTRAFGGSRKEALLALKALATAKGTMFSYEYSTVAIDISEANTSPIGIVIAHPDNGNRQTGQRMVEVVVQERGIMQWLRMLPVAIALERCAVPIPHNVTYVSILAVSPEHRGQGYGSALMAQAESQAMSCGDHAICLDVEVSNVRAIAFYERLGYVKVSETLAGPWLRARNISGLRRMRKELR